MTINRRDFIKKTAQTAIVTGAPLLSIIAEAQPQQVRLKYQTILGNNPRTDRIAALEIMAGQYRDFANYLGGQSSLSVPEDAVIKFVKKGGLRLRVDDNKARRKRHTKVMRRTSWYDKKRGVRVHTDHLQFDLPKYSYKKDSTLQQLTDHLTKGYSNNEEKAQALLCFVQTAIKYDHAKVEQMERGPKFDFVRNPLETLLDQTGDCKDTSVLYASLLKHMGVQPSFLFYENHVNVGVPLDFERNRLKFAPKGLYLDAIHKAKGQQLYIAETTPESPMFVGKLMIQQRGKKITHTMRG